MVVILPNVGVDEVATSCPIDIVPLDTVTPVPPEIAPCALAFVKYKFVEPSPISSVSSVTVPPNDTEFELTVNELFVKLAFGIEPI